MNTRAITGLPSPRGGRAFSNAKDSFREKFQRSLRQCIRRGFSVEESFGMIWVETWEEIPLSEQEQAELYEELIDWAKASTRQLLHSNSQQLFTGEAVGFR